MATLPATGAEKKPTTQPSEPLKIVWGPYLQNLTPKSVTVVWTAGEPSEGAVEFEAGAPKSGRTPPGKPFIPLPKEKYAQRKISPLSKDHEVTLTGLTPGQVYSYRVVSKKPGDGQAAACTTESFRTPTENPKSFCFAILGDTHTYKRSEELAERLIDESPRFILHVGDYGSRVVSGLLKPYKKVMRRFPMYMARGNHDSVKKHKQFVAMPGPGKDLYYSFRWGNARFISVDTNDRKGMQAGGEQYKWLENELKTTKEKWKFVFQHHPLYSAWGGKMDSRLDDERKLLEKYQVHVVFQGHMHNYDRSFPLRDNKVVETGGVTYITASGGCGAQECFPHAHRPWFVARQWRGEPFIGMCNVNGSKAIIQFMTSKGLLFDTLTLRLTEKEVPAAKSSGK
jgi:predicted phosphodiesterase